MVVFAMAVLTAAPTSVLIVPSTPAARPTCEALVEVFASQNVRVKLAGEKAEATGCVKKPVAQRTACLVDSLTRAKVDGIVLVTTTPRGAQLILSMQLLSRTGESERQEKVSGLKPKLAVWAKPAIERTIATLTAVIVEEPRPTPVVVEKPAPTERPADAPVEPKLTPREPSHPELVATPPPPARPSKAGAWVMTGVAIAAGGTAAAFGGLGLANKGRLDHLDNGVSTLSYSQAVALQGQTNLDMTVALGAGAGAAVAAIIAGVLWAN
jgi:hypothetical protein